MEIVAAENVDSDGAVSRCVTSPQSSGPLAVSAVARHVGLRTLGEGLHIRVFSNGKLLLRAAFSTVPDPSDSKSRKEKWQSMGRYALTAEGRESRRKHICAELHRRTWRRVLENVGFLVQPRNAASQYFWNIALLISFTRQYRVMLPHANPLLAQLLSRFVEQVLSPVCSITHAAPD